MCSCIKTCMIRIPSKPLMFIVENYVCSWCSKTANGDVSVKPGSFNLWNVVQYIVVVDQLKIQDTYLIYPDYLQFFYRNAWRQLCLLPFSDINVCPICSSSNKYYCHRCVTVNYYLSGRFPFIPVSTGPNNTCKNALYLQLTTMNTMDHKDNAQLILRKRVVGFSTVYCTMTKAYIL